MTSTPDPTPGPGPDTGPNTGPDTGPGPAPIILQCQTAPCERPSVIAAAKMLNSSLAHASGGTDWPVRLRFVTPGTPLTPMPDATAIILSLLPAANRTNEAIAATQERWHARIEPLLDAGIPIFLRTIFRHVPNRARDGGPTPLLARIRELNRMAADLSQMLGVSIIDIDRACANFGARPMRSDWQLGGDLAPLVAGYAMARGLLSLGLDHVIDPAILEKAITSLLTLGRADTWQEPEAQTPALSTPT